MVKLGYIYHSHKKTEWSMVLRHGKFHKNQPQLGLLKLEVCAIYGSPRIQEKYGTDFTSFTISLGERVIVLLLLGKRNIAN